MELNQKFFSNLYKIIFWYMEDKELPKSLCPLFWQVVFGILFLVPASFLVLLEKICTVVYNIFKPFLIKKDKPYKETFFDRLGEKTVDYGDKVKSKLGKHTELIVTLVVNVLFFLLFYESAKLNNSYYNFYTKTLVVIALICFATSIIMLVLLFTVYFFAFMIIVLEKINETKYGNKVFSFINTKSSNFFSYIYNKLKYYFEFIMENYCPKINWK